MNEYQPYIVANDALRIHETLKARMDRDGYLFLRDVVSRPIVDRLRSDIRALLIEKGYVEDDPMVELKWSGKLPDPEQIGLSSPIQRWISEMRSMRALVESDDLLSMLRTLFNGEVFNWLENLDRVRIQFQDVSVTNAGGQQAPFATPAHQDGYHFPVPFYSVWIPLMDIDLPVGGLAVRAGSHTEGLQQHWWQGGRYLGIPDTVEQAEVFEQDGGVAVAGDVDPDAVPKIWLRSDYRVGDVVVFHPRLIHRGVANTSPQLRLSVDLRYSKQGDPLVWQAQCRLYECHAYLEQARRCLDGMSIEGSIADRAWELMRREGPSDEIDVGEQARLMVDRVIGGR